MPAFVVFEVESQTLALPASEVEGILRMAALAPLHGVPPCVEGVIDVHGELVPVVDVRTRLGLPRRGPRPEDHLVLVARGASRVALRVDRVVDLATVADDAYTRGGGWSAGSELVAGALRLASGVVVVEALSRLVPAEVAPGAA
jgi:purine-binding chemotaxis protein CheW